MCVCVCEQRAHSRPSTPCNLKRRIRALGSAEWPLARQCCLHDVAAQCLVQPRVLQLSRLKPVSGNVDQAVHLDHARVCGGYDHGRILQGSNNEEEGYMERSGWDSGEGMCGGTAVSSRSGLLPSAALCVCAGSARQGEGCRQIIGHSCVVQDPRPGEPSPPLQTAGPSSPPC